MTNKLVLALKVLPNWCVISSADKVRGQGKISFSLRHVFLSNSCAKRIDQMKLTLCEKSFEVLRVGCIKKCCNGIDAPQKEFAKLTCYITCIIYPTPTISCQSVGQELTNFTQFNLPSSVLPLGWCTWYLW